MNTQIVIEWVAALRSGEYRQGTGCLRSDDDYYCCLGVAKEVLLKHGIGEPWVGEPHTDYTETEDDDSPLDGSLASSSLDVLGVSYGAENILQQMNDGTAGSARHSFPEIADWIEQNVLADQP